MSYLTTKEVAQQLGCTQRNICHLIKANKITPSVTLANGHFLFTENDVKMYNFQKENYAK
jgi:excisionase family DNA binding protein